MKITAPFLALPLLICFWSMQSYADDLYDVYTHALASDPQLKAAEAAFLATMEQKPQALAALKPQINLSGGASYNMSYDIDGDTTHTLNGNYSLSARKALIQQEANAQVDLADVNVAKARADFAEQQQNLIIRVADAYFNFLKMQENLEYVRAEKLAVLRQLRQVKAFFDVGKSPITDVQETESQLDLVTAREIVAMQQLDLAREAIKTITGRYYRSLDAAPLNTSLSPPIPSTIKGWIELAFQNSKTLESYEYAVLVAQSSIDKIKAADRATLDLVASQSGSISWLDADSESLDASVGVQFAVPISSGGRTDSAIRQARHSLHQSQHQLESQRRIIEQSIKVNYLSVMAGIAQSSAYARALGSAETAARAASIGFQVGTRTAVDVLLRVKDVFSAKNNLANARYTYMLDMLKLRQSAGVLEPDNLAELRVHLHKRQR